MFVQGTPFSWHGNQPESNGLSIFRSPVSGLYSRGRKTQQSERHYEIRTISRHQTLEGSVPGGAAVLMALNRLRQLAGLSPPAFPFSSPQPYGQRPS